MTALNLRSEWGVVPDGTVWPGPNTLVLLNRPLRPGTDPRHLSRFCDERWDLNPAVFEDHVDSITLNFAFIPEQLRTAAKYYMWQLINHEDPPAQRAVRGKRLAVRSLSHNFVNVLQFVLKWFADQGVSQFCQITAKMLDDYLEAMEQDEVSIANRRYRVMEVRRLWAHRELLPAAMRLPPAPPWHDADPRDLFGHHVRQDRENRTVRVGEQTMQMLLLWAIRFVEVFAQDILAAHAEHLELHAFVRSSRRPELARAGDLPKVEPGELANKVATYLDTLRERGESLPGLRGEDGALTIHWNHLARLVGRVNRFKDSAIGRSVMQSGLPVGEHNALQAPITALLDGRPWRAHRIDFDQAPRFARLLSTACLIVTAYLSGARSGEVLNLRRGCVEYDEASGLWLMTGLYFKGAVDEDGNKIPEGEMRPDPWVILEIVARAIAVLERLHPDPLLFPTQSLLSFRTWCLSWENSSVLGV